MTGNADEEMKRFRRRMNTSRREIRKAVERAAKTDLRHGHYVEARRLALEIRDAADEAVRMLERRQAN